MMVMLTKGAIMPLNRSPFSACAGMGWSVALWQLESVLLGCHCSMRVPPTAVCTAAGKSGG